MVLLTSYIIKYKIIPRNTGPELRFTATRKSNGKIFNEVAGLKSASPKIDEINVILSSALDRLESLENIPPIEMLMKTEIEVTLKEKGFLKIDEHYEDLKTLSELTVAK